ncbi:MAG: PAS domain S-box protein [Armatimonadetes bacterium]|nr:PAS domain S-box protein [Armatimonadota bacterium]
MRCDGTGENASAYLLVQFEELADDAGGATPSLADETPEDLARLLEEQIARLQMQLRGTVNQYEATVEELKASNEEQQSVNEELRSTTEELETSKEELQSVNEELSTLNQELKNRLDELSAANADLQNLLVSTDIGMLFLGRDLRIKRYTPPTESLFNLIASDVGRPLQHVTHKMEYPDLARDAESVLKRLTMVEREVPDTDGRWFLARIRPYRTLEDQIDGVVLSFLDITERRQAENALRESEARFRRMADSVPQIIWITDREGRIEFFNRQWTAYTGKAYEPVTAGEIASTVVHPDDVALTMERFDEARRNGKTFLVEHRIRSAAGDYRWFLVRAEPYRDPATGQIVQWFGVSTDIHDRRIAEEALRQSEERFRLMVEGAQDYAMFMLDPQNRVIFWSKGAERIFGWTEAEMLGRSGEIIFTPEDRERGEPEKEIRTALKEGRAQDKRWHVRKDGSRLWADGINMRLNDEPGGLRGFAKIARDATLERRQEEDLMEAKRELEARVAERTASLSEALVARETALAQRQIAEEAQARLLRQLVTAQEEERTRISRELHDRMGQLLTGWLLELKALQGSLAGGEAAERLERLLHRASELGREIHTLAWELRPPALDDLGLLTTLANFVQEWGRQAGIGADFHSSGLESMRLPNEIETTLYRITQEALNNVARHSGASRVSILLERRDGHIDLIVEDNGSGFDPDEALYGPAAGHHLGLRGMRERAALLGGTLEVESEPGLGTTLFIRVPMGGGASDA